jgi:predicted MFS family arabinose efflux permease
MFDIGSFIGGMLIGFLGDRIGKRAVLISPSLLIAAGLMILVKVAGTDNAVFYYFTIFGIGLF